MNGTRSTRKSTPYFNRIPPEVTLRILSYLESLDLDNCRLLSTGFNHLICTSRELRYRRTKCRLSFGKRGEEITINASIFFNEINEHLECLKFIISCTPISISFNGFAAVVEDVNGTEFSRETVKCPIPLLNFYKIKSNKVDRWMSSLRGEQFIFVSSLEKAVTLAMECLSRFSWEMRVENYEWTRKELDTITKCIQKCQPAVRRLTVRVDGRTSEALHRCINVVHNTGCKEFEVHSGFESGSEWILDTPMRRFKTIVFSDFADKTLSDDDSSRQQSVLIRILKMWRIGEVQCEYIKFYHAPSNITDEDFKSLDAKFHQPPRSCLRNVSIARSKDSDMLSILTFAKNSNNHLTVVKSSLCGSREISPMTSSTYRFSEKKT